MSAKLFINNGGNLSACVPVKLDSKKARMVKTFERIYFPSSPRTKSSSEMTQTIRSQRKERKTLEAKLKPFVLELQMNVLLCFEI